MVVPNHFQEHFEEKMYRTGDIVTVGEDGNYYFQGRRDSMIKSRGYRIELGEIESALLSHPGVREAAVLAVPDEIVGNRIRAVVAIARCRFAERVGTAAVLCDAGSEVHDSGVDRYSATSCPRPRRERLIASSWRRSRRRNRQAFANVQSSVAISSL